MESEIKQGSIEWKMQRLGKVTASRVADVVARTKTGWGASRANYSAQLIAERLTGMPQETYTNGAMQWGTDTEPKARAAYAFFSDHPVTEAPYIGHPDILMSGCSPDGLVADDGLVEFKCPNTATHIETMLGDPIEKKYLLQMQWQMACTGKSWCDFVSFDPRLPVDLQIKIIRVNRDNDLIHSLEKDVRDFLAEIESKVSALQNITQREAA